MRMRSSSSTASARGKNDTSIGRSAASSAFTSSSTRGPKPSGSGSNSKSMRADSGSMFPPVTGTRHSFQITPQSTCSAVCVRISAWRRSQSTSASTSSPTVGGTPSMTCQTSPSALRTSVTLSPIDHARVVRLTTPGGVEGAAIEGHGAVSHADHLGREGAQVGVAQVQRVGAGRGRPSPKIMPRSNPVAER